MSHLDNEITSLTPPVLTDLASHIEAFSEQLRRLANENEQKLASRAHNMSRKKKIKAATVDFIKLTDGGLPSHDALDKVTTKHCIDPLAVKMSQGVVRQKMRTAAKVELDRKIMLFYRAGYKTHEIASKVQRDRKTVQRTIKEFMDI